VLSVPARVVKKRYALTAKPLFSGDMALRSIVMAGELQHSANRYSKKSPVIETQKLVWINVQTAIVGHPKTEPIMQTQALILGYYFSSLSDKIPPVIAEIKPPTLTTNALRVK